MRPIRCACLCFLVILLVVYPAGNGQAKKTDGKIAAKVAGIEITASALDEKSKGDLIRFQAEMYDAKKRYLDKMIADILLSKEGEKQGKTAEEIRKGIAIDATVSVTETAIKEFYDKNVSRFGGKTWDDVKENIRTALIEKETQDREAELIAQLKSKYPVEIFLEEPKFSIDISNQPSRGPENAKITLVEFSDFQCPYCGQFKKTLDKVREEFPNDVKQVFRHNPLPFHGQARRAHHAAICAHRQGKFWEYRDLLFDHQSELEEASLKVYAEMTGLNSKQFEECLGDAEVDKQLDRDFEYAQSVGARGTPTSFINGTLYPGARSYEEIKSVIQDKLKQSLKM